MVKKMVKNFDYFALKYLNLWVNIDRGIFNDLKSTDRSVRREALHRGAKEYSVVRTIRLIPGEETGESRLSKALDCVDSIEPYYRAPYYKPVMMLAERLRDEGYGDNLISASSKFLWLRYRGGVRIYDSRAIRSIRHLLGDMEDPPGDIDQKRFEKSYQDYEKAWNACFEMYSDEVNSAIASLGKVKQYSLAYETPPAKFDSWINSKWFRERVFDMFLWHNGGDDDDE